MEVGWGWRFVGLLERRSTVHWRLVIGSFVDLLDGWSREMMSMGVWCQMDLS